MNPPALKDINAAIAKLMVAEQALDDACAVMRLHDEKIDPARAAAGAQCSKLLATFCQLYGERVKIDGDPERAAAWDAAVGPPSHGTPPGRYRCRQCLTIWTKNQDSTWRLTSPGARPGACCDNAPDFLSRLERA